jgi:hypothetical protein
MPRMPATMQVWDAASHPTALLDFENVNHTGTAVTVQPSQVHFIANGGQADQVFGTPFGTAARNSLRDYQVNSANFSLYRTVKITERLNVRFHMSMLNVFNHPNFGNSTQGSIDPVLEDLGDNHELDGFGVPSLFASAPQGFAGGTRSIRFGLKVLF